MRGPIQLAGAILGSGYFFFIYDGRWPRKHPTYFQEFQSGDPSDFAVLVSLGMIICIGYAVAVTNVDFRDGRW